MKSKVFLFITLILVGILFGVSGCDNFLNANNRATVTFNLDLSKIVKTSRNETSQNSEYILKVFAYNAAGYKSGKEIENLVLLSQIEKKVGINGQVKASLEIEIGLNVIFVGKLYEIGGVKPIYSGNSEVVKIKATDNKVNLVLSKDTTDLEIDIEVHQHTFATEWKSDETEHWHVATCEHTTEVGGKAKHTFGDWKVNKESTEEEEGSKERTCTVCGYTATEVIEKLAHTHKFATDWTKDGTYHWYAATCEHTTEVSEKAKHTFGDWIVTKDPTEEAEGSKERVCTVCNYKEVVDIAKIPEGFVFVKGGTVTGALPAWLDESASDGYKGVFIEGRTVTLSDFYMGKYEVTQVEYASVMQGQKVTVNGTEYTLASDPSYCKKDSTSYTLFEGDEQTKRPVEGVSWYDAVWYCNALSAKEGLTKAYNIEVTSVKQISGTTDYYIYGATVTLNKDATGYRLPTEAEWEYAARGGDPTKVDWNYTFSGAPTAEGVSYKESINAGLDCVGWYCYNNKTGATTEDKQTTEVEGKGTHEVGKKAANRLGIYDMSGNVHEWCYDLYSSISKGIESDPTGALSGSSRVYHGGCWSNIASYSSVSVRVDCAPFSRDQAIGFRVVRSATTE